MIRGINELYHLKQSNPDKALDMVCKEFESVFAHELMKVMGESIPEGLFGDGLGSDIYKDMLYQAVGDKLAESGSLGISKMLRQHMQSLGKENERSSGTGDGSDKNVGIPGKHEPEKEAPDDK
jgi:Rod binding domain-containing protein